MDIKYNIYYSTKKTGPWTLANNTPVDHVNNELMEYTVTGLKQATVYYIVVIGGIVSNNIFVPMITQPIAAGSIGAGDVDIVDPIPIIVKTFAPNIVTTGSLGHQFEVV